MSRNHWEEVINTIQDYYLTPLWYCRKCKKEFKKITNKQARCPYCNSYYNTVNIFGNNRGEKQ